MSTKPHILYTKPLSDHRQALLEQMVDVSLVKALDPVMLPVSDMPEAAEWIIVTSPHALTSVREAIEHGWGANSKWACVGFRAQDLFEEMGIQATIKEGNAKALIKRLPKSGSAIYLCGKDRTPSIEDFMGNHDWELTILETYWTQATHPHIDFSQYDAVVFFSPRNVLSVLKHNHWVDGVAPLAIGPTTAEAMRKEGIEPLIVPESADVLLLTQQYLEYLQNGTTE